MTIEITPQLLDELDAKAKAATPGPWECEPGDPDIFAEGGGCIAHIQVHASYHTIQSTGEEFSSADAEFIAAANPETVLALVGEVRRLTARFEQASELYRTCQEDRNRFVERAMHAESTEAELAKVKADLASLTGAKPFAEIAAERDRYREALEYISDPRGQVLASSDAVARKALGGKP